MLYRWAIEELAKSGAEGTKPFCVTRSFFGFANAQSVFAIDLDVGFTKKLFLSGTSNPPLWQDRRSYTVRVSQVSDANIALWNLKVNVSDIGQTNMAFDLTYLQQIWTGRTKNLVRQSPGIKLIFLNATSAFR